MKKISARASAVLLIALLVIFGMIVYILRFVDNGEDWALYFTQINSGDAGEVLDRNGVTLASFSTAGNYFNEDEQTRIANYHVTGDYWGRSSAGILSNYNSSVAEYSMITGISKAPSISSLQLTVDSALNNVAYEALGADRDGAVLVCDYTTGEIICLVSSASLDPANPEPELRNGAFINRCLSASFVPGSIFKLITSAAAIETVSDIFQRSFHCGGAKNVSGVMVNCTGVHGDQSFEQALSNSCNCAFAEISLLVGQETMRQYVESFGFVSTHNLDGLQVVAGSYLTEETVGDAELAWSSIGQSTDLVCPYSMMRYVSAIANSGIVCEPSLIMSDEAPEMSRLLDAQTATKLTQMMNYNAVSHYNAAVNFPGLEICAKTGTAEVGDGTSHSWFTGFLLDSEHPYAFVVLVEHGGYGITAAGSVANTVLQAAVNN